MIHIPLQSDDLMEEGLCMEIEIMPSFEYLKEKGIKKQQIPVFKTTALFDTGAKTCAVDKSIIEALGIPSYQSCSVKTPFHTVEREVYQLIFKIPGKKEYFPVVAVIADFSADRCKAIIGRNFLQYGLFVYDGANQMGFLNVTRY